MILYEVNLSISLDIFDDYLTWLEKHIKIMLRFSGFKKAILLKDIRTVQSENGHITVQYLVDNIESLNNYLDNHSQQMRDDGLRRFQGKFSASRKVFEISKEFL